MLMPNSSPRRRRGFTLVELMVVLVIIGLLAGIVVVSLGGETDKARQTTATATLKSISDAIERYKLANNEKLPERLEQLIEGPSDWDAQANGKWRPLLQSKAVPKDPWGKEYVYEIVDPEYGEFRVTCYGKDGEPGGAGVAKDIVFPPQGDDGSGAGGLN